MTVHGKTKRSHSRVEADLRRRIVQGVFAPGAQLPTRAEIEQQFGVGMPTVQKALNALARDGFVHAKPGAGTFVCDHPPHLFQYGLVFPDPAFRSRFYTALKAAADHRVGQQRIRIAPYFHHHPVDHERLNDDVVNYRLAGVLFVHPQWDLWDDLAVRTPGVPRVVIAGESKHSIPSLDVDTVAFYRMAVAKLASLGRRRIAALIPEGPPQALVYQQALAEQGLESRPYWCCHVAGNMGPQAVASTTRLLLELDDSKRPDGLIVVDDNLVSPVLQAALASPLRVPEQLHIVAHCNYPLPHDNSLPMIQLGFDCQMFIDEALHWLVMQREGKQPPLRKLVQPRFQEA